MIVCLIIIAFFVFKAPKLAFLSIPLCIIYVAIKSKIKEDSSQDKKNDHDFCDEWDETFEDDLHK